ncbi:hypothetical protein [Kitasatospora sp. NPDC090091]|uniref:hypothetical protein n=1 Tax=Kitasatospora sp. NPDC090091 TaxID=3364081 RepID=UPI00380CEE35
MDSTVAFNTITNALGPRAGEPSPATLTAVLRGAEAASTGPLRDMWGFAAAAAEAAGGDTVSRRGRELWATAADYARRAADLEIHTPTGETVGAGRS